MEPQVINTVKKLTIESSKTTRYLGYPRKVPLWRLKISLPKVCKIYRFEDCFESNFSSFKKSDNKKANSND